MAVRFSTATDALNQTTSVPANTSFTLMGDCVIVFDRGSGNSQVIAGEFNASFTDGVAIAWNESGFARGTVTVTDAGVATSRGEFSSRPEQNRPFCWYLKCSGTGAGLVEGGWRYPGGRWVKANATLGATIAAPTTIHYGQIAGSLFVHKRLSNLKTWSRALSDIELLQESESYEPLAKNGLHSWHPLISATNVTDLSGLGRNLTVTNCTTQNLYYPRPVKRPKLIVAEAPAVGTTFQILAGRKFSLAGMAGLAGD